MIILQDLLNAAEASVVGPLNAQIVQLQADLAGAQAALAGAQADLAAALAQLDPLNAQVASLTAQIASLNAQIVSLQAELAAFPGLYFPSLPNTYNTGCRGAPPTGTAPTLIDTDNVVVEDKRLTMAGLVVTGANFIMRNCSLTYTAAIGIDAQNAINASMIDCSVTPSGTAARNCFRGAGTVRGNNIVINTNGYGGLVLMGPSLVRDNFIHDANPAAPTYTAFGGNLAGSTFVNNVVS